MSPYLVILFGASLGMLLLIAARSVQIQIGKKYELGFVDAFRVYTTKYTGPIVVGYLVIFIGMFVFPDIVANYTAEDGEYTQVLQKVLKWLRIMSVALGVLSQGLGFLIIRRGDKYLRDAENKIESSSQQQ